MKNKILLVAAVSVAVLSLYVLSSSHGHSLRRSKRLLPFLRTQSRGNQHRNHQSIPFIKTTVGASAFTITNDFTFPHRLKTLTDVKKIVSTKWVLDLASIMTRWPIKRTVIVVSGNTEFQKPLLNWMISAVFKANISLDRILILVADDKLHGLLEERNIGSILVPPSSVYDSSLKLSTHKLVTYSRFAVVRLLNHWGFTVAHFDSDALLLRDIEEIFDEYPSSSIVASIDNGPYEVNMCAGAILFRSNQQIEDFWTETSRWDGINDQRMLNDILLPLKVKWYRHQLNDAAEGQCLKTGMRISIMPSTVVCRQKCSADLLDRVYIWHPLTKGQGNGQDIIKTMSKENLVFISQDWSRRCSSGDLAGEAWLKCISTGT